MTLRMAVAIFVLTFAASVMPVAAHHSVPETFDVSKEITIQGPVTKIEWTNPHGRFWVDARNDDGTVSNWELELPPPTVLKRRLGLDFIKFGDQVTVDLWRAKDGSLLANTLTLTVPDGRVFNFSRSTTTSWAMPKSPK
jgi:Family of unknown function (DUF6152)